MARHDTLEWASIGDFSFGLNTQDKSHRILDRQCAAVQNMDLSSKGAASTRLGFDNFNTDEIASATGIYGATYARSNHLVAALTDVYKKANGAYSSIKGSFTSNSETFFDEWNGYVYVTNGAETMWRWDGATAANITYPHSDWASYPPNFIASHDNAMWAFRASNSKLYKSRIDDGSGDDYGDNWDTTNANAIDDAMVRTVDGSNGFSGTGIVSQKGGLVVFKEEGIYKVEGKTTISFTVNNLYRTIGCCASRTIVNVDNRIIFLARHKGDFKVYVLDDGGGLTYLSNNITTDLNLIHATNYTQAAAIFHKDKYKLSFPLAAGGWVTYNLNLIDGSWEKDSGNSMRCYYVQGNTLYGGSTSGGFTFTMDTGTNDNSVKITSYIRTKNLLLKAPNRAKTARDLYVLAKASGAWKMDITIRVDDKLDPHTWPMDLGARDAVETMRWYKVPLDTVIRGGMINFQFGTSTIDQPFEIYDSYLTYEVGDEYIN